jgi:hypothetical protein
MAEIIRLKARRRGRIEPRLSLFSIVFVSTFMLASVVAWYVASDATTTVATKITPNTIQVVDGDIESIFSHARGQPNDSYA